MALQIILNGIFLGAIYLLIGIGFNIVYNITHFFHFAHAVVFTSGAYFTFLFHKLLGLPIFPAIPLAIALSAFLGSLMELSVYRSLRRKNASPMILLLASLGIYIVLQNTISMIFGDDTKSMLFVVNSSG